MNLDLISIIVPIYNVAPYLENCLDSIINQTYKNIEIICIEDCSTDNSADILKRYQKLDSRIVAIYNNTNEGIGITRQTALKIAKGEFIGFVDSDDFICINMYEELYQNAINHNADIVVCGNYIIKDSIFYKQKQLMNYDLFDNETSILQLLDGKISFYCWNKLYKKSLFSNIEFSKTRYSEDVNIVTKLLYKANKVLCIDKCLYFYRERTDSITHSKFSKNTLNMIQEFEIFNDFINENFNNKYKKKALYILGFYIFMSLCLAYKCKDIKLKNELYIIRKYCIKYFIYIFFSKFLTIKQKIGLLVKLITLQYHLCFLK